SRPRPRRRPRRLRPGRRRDANDRRPGPWRRAALAGFGADGADPVRIAGHEDLRLDLAVGGDGPAESPVLRRDDGSAGPDALDHETGLGTIQVFGGAVASDDRDAHSRRAADVVVDPGVEIETVFRVRSEERDRRQRQGKGAGSEASHGFLLRGFVTSLLELASQRMRRLGLLASGLWIWAAGISAQAPSAPWRTIETSHFRLHFPPPFEPWVARAAAAIEGIHERVTEFIGYRPPRPIDVLVGDPAAEANGAAFPFLDRPYIVLWTSPPESESGIGDYTEWMDLLVTHEMAHIVHLTRPRNRPGFLEKALPLPLGPVLLNSPRWVIEGYATVVEGALTGSGRP